MSMIILAIPYLSEQLILSSTTFKILIALYCVIPFNSHMSQLLSDSRSSWIHFSTIKTGEPQTEESLLCSSSSLQGSSYISTLLFILYVLTQMLSSLSFFSPLEQQGGLNPFVIHLVVTNCPLEAYLFLLPAGNITCRISQIHLWQELICHWCLVPSIT